MDTIIEIRHLVGAIALVQREPDSADKLERLRTLEVCLLLAAKKL